MARASRLVALGALALSFCILLRSDGIVAKVPAPTQEAARSEQLAVAIVLLLAAIIQSAMSLLPGLAVAAGIYAIYSRSDRLSAKTRGGLTVLLVLAVVALVFGSNVMAGKRALEQESQTDGLAERGGVIEEPHSGEEVLMSDGTFKRLADPSRIDGTLDQESDWRQKLAHELVMAIQKGQEQVVIMFTRQGCPWCDRQLPVLQDAIRRRAAAAGAGAASAATAFVGGGGTSSMLAAPLRVFILDAEEFPGLVRQFGVEAFPTSLIFGRPRVTPLLGRGFLDEETFEQVCREAALAEPEPEEGAPPPRKRKGRRGLFR